jgi:hypothetical protein
MLGGFALAAYAVSARLLRGRGPSVRACGAVVFLLWGLGVVFELLGAIGSFRPGPALGVSSAASAVVLGPSAVRRMVLEQLGEDIAALRAAWLALAIPTRALVTGVVAIGALVAVRGLVAPPMAWDDLTYHLYKAGSWVQAGRRVDAPAPDGWTFQAFFPGSGEVLWSWFLLPARDGAFLALGSLAAWAVGALGAYGAARRLGCDRDRAALAAAAIAMVPAAAVFIDTSYVDNLALAGFLLGLVFLLELRRRFALGPAFAAIAGFALMAGSKQSGVAFVVVAAGCVIWYSARAPERRAASTFGRSLQALAVVGVGGLVAAPWYARAWRIRGQPLYPTAVPRLGLRGNAQLRAVLEVGAPGLAPLDHARHEGLLERLGQVYHALSLGPRNLSPLLGGFLLLAAVATLRGLARRRTRAPTAFLAFTVAMAVAEITSVDHTALRVVWGGVLGRLVLSAFAACVLLAATLAWRPLRALWCIAIPWEGWLSARYVLGSWGPPDRAALVAWLGVAIPLLAIALGLAWVAVKRAPRGLRLVTLGTATLLVLLALSDPLAAVREHYRAALYDAAGRGAAYRLQPTAARCLWPLWEKVDDGPGHVVAVTTKFGGAGDNLFRFPFLGSELQNSVVYVPISTTGSMVDFWGTPTAERQFDSRAWLRRVRDRRVDYLAVLLPGTPEAAAIARSSRRFRLVAAGVRACAGARLYRLEPLVGASARP